MVDPLVVVTEDLLHLPGRVQAGYWLDCCLHILLLPAVLIHINASQENSLTDRGTVPVFAPNEAEKA
jgi:hypothetical protein